MCVCVCVHVCARVCVGKRKKAERKEELRCEQVYHGVIGILHWHIILFVISRQCDK